MRPYADQAKVIPVGGAAVVLELNIVETGNQTVPYGPAIDSTPVLYWLERIKWETHKADDGKLSQVPIATLWPVVPTLDGVPSTYSVDRSDNVIGWTVVHGGLLTEEDFRTQLSILGQSALHGLCFQGDRCGAVYELMEGVAANNPNDLLSRSGHWVHEDPNVQSDMTHATDVILRVIESAPDMDLDDLPLAPSVRKMVLT